MARAIWLSVVGDSATPQDHSPINLGQVYVVDSAGKGSVTDPPTRSNGESWVRSAHGGFGIHNAVTIHPYILEASEPPTKDVIGTSWKALPTLLPGAGVIFAPESKNKIVLWFELPKSPNPGVGAFTVEDQILEDDFDTRRQDGKNVVNVEITKDGVYNQAS